MISGGVESSSLQAILIFLLGIFAQKSLMLLYLPFSLDTLPARKHCLTLISPPSFCLSTVTLLAE